MKTSCLTHFWTAPDGETFPYSEWRPAGPACAVVVAVHGLSGAAMDFEPLGRHLVEPGLVTLAIELRGQGNDPQVERRGDLVSIKAWFHDLSAFLALVRERYPGLSIFYYGESMGGAILTRFVAQAPALEQPAGLVLASPVISWPQRPAWWQEQLFRFFLFVRPTYRIDVQKLIKKGEAPKWVTRNEEHRAWFETAPHKLTCFTVRFFKCLLELIMGCHEAAAHIQVPILVLYAANDVFITPKRVEDFFELIATRDKELQFYPQAYHLLLHDDDQTKVLERVRAWLSLHLARFGRSAGEGCNGKRLK